MCFQLFFVGYIVGRCVGNFCSVNPAVSPVTARMGISGTVTDPSRMLDGEPVGGPVPITVTSAGQRYNVTAMVGATLYFDISASWAEFYTAQNLTLYAYEEPGLPNGATLGPVVCSGICNPISRQLTWTPARGQEGRIHTMCFTAHPISASLAACVSPYRCIDVHVAVTHISFEPITPKDGMEMHSPVGCELELCVEARDSTGVYNVDINRECAYLSARVQKFACAKQACMRQTSDAFPPAPECAYCLKTRFQVPTFSPNLASSQHMND